MILLAGGMAQAQSSSLSKKEQKQLLKEERKEEAAKIAEQQLAMVAGLIEKATFVLEADRLFDRYGQSYQVSSSINFIMIDSLYGIIQVGNSYNLGQNGVGGVTVDGSISNYTFTKNEKRNTYSVSYDLRSTFGTYNVHLTTSGGSNADATVSGSFSGTLRYSGRLVHPAASKVYKGTSY